MKIAFDATYSLGLSGIGVYSREMIWGLGALRRDVRFMLYYRRHKFVRSFLSSVPSNATRRLLLPNGDASKAELFHALNQRVDSSRYRHTVTTFHDLFVLTGDYSTPDFRRRFAEQARQAAERSDLIIAVSHFTARQVEQLLGVQSARIRVVPHGVHAAVGTPDITGEHRQKLILFVGVIQRRKNIARLVQAFERVSTGWRLILVGPMGYGSEEVLEGIGRSPRRDSIELRGYVPADELRRLYASASIFAFPSLDEGFGIPVLEAMAAGVPVLTSARSALPEVAGGAALLVDSTDIEAIVNGLQNLMSDPDLRTDLATRGLARSAIMSWESAVENTWKVYEEFLT